jgi:hypothetical protein
LLGTGSKGSPRQHYASLILEANESGLPIISVDIPSGIDADTGEVFVPCIQASQTVTFAFPKRGLLQYPGASQAGIVTVCPIGIPVQLAEQLGVRTFQLDPRSLTERLGVDPARARSADGHKGTYGHVLLAAGSRSMSGAGLLSGKAALRGGCGLVSWALPEQLVLPVLGRVPELMLLGLGGRDAEDWSAVPPQALAELAEGKDALVLGPGMGRWTGDSAWLRAVWEGTACPLVLDADALNMLAGAGDFAGWPARRTPAVLTISPGCGVDRGPGAAGPRCSGPQLCAAAPSGLGAEGRGHGGGGSQRSCVLEHHRQSGHGYRRHWRCTRRFDRQPAGAGLQRRASCGAWRLHPRRSWRSSCREAVFSGVFDRRRSAR